MIPVLYVSSSSYSGSTLLSFLLNAHPGMTTVGEAEGWNYSLGEVFRCSCGAPLGECPLFHTVAEAFRREGLPFDPREFGTRYRLVANERLNRHLAAELPAIVSSRLERARDRLVRIWPGITARIARHDRANVVLARTVLAANHATVFVDVSKSPYRLRQLRRIAQLDVRALHLVRDPRGVAASNMRKKNYTAHLAIRLWLAEQCTIARIAREEGATMTVLYEDICKDTGTTLAAIHTFAGLPPQPEWATYQRAPHHILGNEMRLGPVAPIVNDVRWMRELSAADLTTIAEACRRFRQNRPEHPVSNLIGRYGCDVAALPTTAPPERTSVTSDTHVA